MKRTAAESFTFRIWIAGGYAEAVQACREFTIVGLCVSVQPVEYVYTMGAESGVVITLLNYPRFPKSQEEVAQDAESLARFLINRLYQGSCSIEGPNETVWLTRREQD